MGRRSVTKKLLKLKKGGEKKSKRSTKQTPNQQARYPVETKEFSFGDVHKPATEQTVVGIRNGKIIPIDKITYQSDLPNIEIAISPELRKGIKNQTIKNRMRKLNLKEPKNKIIHGYSPEHGFTDQSLKDKIILLKLHEPKTLNKTRKSRSSEKSYETGYASQ